MARCNRSHFEDAGASHELILLKATDPAEREAHAERADETIDGKPQ